MWGTRIEPEGKVGETVEKECLQTEICIIQYTDSATVDQERTTKHEK